MDGEMAGSLLSALTRPDATILSVYAAHEAFQLKNDLFLSPAIVNTSKMGGSNLHTSMHFFCYLLIFPQDTVFLRRPRRLSVESQRQ